MNHDNDHDEYFRPISFFIYSKVQQLYMNSNRFIVRNWNRLRLKYFFGRDKNKCSLLSTLLMGFLPYKLN